MKGQSGNPNGRPKGSFLSLTSLIKEKLAEIPEGQTKGQTKTYATLLIEKMLKKAIVDGDVQMIRTVWAYIEGLPQQKVDVTSGGEQLYTWSNYTAEEMQLEKQKQLDEAVKKLQEKNDGNKKM